MQRSVFRRTAWLAAATVAAASALGLSATTVTSGAVAAGGALALWLLAAATATPVLDRRPRLRPRYYAGLLALAATALVADPWAGFGIWVVAVHAFLLFPARRAFGWSVGGAVLLTVAQTGLSGAATLVLLSLLPPLLVAGVVLARAHRQLEAALATNAALQRQLVEQAEAAGRQDERGRVARDIHDTLAQDLSAAAVLLEGVEDSDERVARARELVRGGLGEARRTVRALTPAALDGVPLPVALDRLARDWAGRTGIAASFTGDPAPLVTPDVAAAVYRVAQSALANVAEHAGAGRVQLTLSRRTGCVVLDVRDDGAGFRAPREPVRGRGFGLTGMRDRVTALGGTLEVESAPGAGTAVRVELPARSGGAGP
ncbi:sensor histidine kinase [Actinoplanes sp. RD1]|uniref:sensor histidine kinase n=1 Tax=Actinoplanes sp. RD1 TaxID=3064538 RepID=UPI00274089DA|nr:sensor histidine kinase [Actinoplanes sp. RD1]